MRIILFVALAVLANYSFGQTNLEEKPIARKGFIIGGGLGAGVLTLKTNDTVKVSFQQLYQILKLDLC